MVLVLVPTRIEGQSLPSFILGWRPRYYSTDFFWELIAFLPSCKHLPMSQFRIRDRRFRSCTGSGRNEATWVRLPQFTAFFTVFFVLCE